VYLCMLTFTNSVNVVLYFDVQCKGVYTITTISLYNPGHVSGNDCILYQEYKACFLFAGTSILTVFCCCSICVFSKSELTFAFAICYRRSVCLSVVCNVRAPYSAG